jgi:hypothetical protein
MIPSLFPILKEGGVWEELAMHESTISTPRVDRRYKDDIAADRPMSGTERNRDSRDLRGLNSGTYI